MKNQSFLKGAAIIAAGGFLAKLIGALYRIPLTNLIGGYGIDKDKSTRFADGPLTRAGRHGCVFLVNVRSAAPPDLWLSGNEL